MTYGNYDFRQVHAYASGPLAGDVLAARVSLSKTDRDGYSVNRFDGRRTQNFHDLGLRGQLLFKPGASFKLRVIGDCGRQRPQTANAILEGVIRIYTNGVTFANNYNDRAARLGYIPVPLSTTARVVDVDADPRYRLWQAGAAAIADLTLPGNTLTSVTAWRTWRWFPHNDGDSTSLDAGRDFHQSNIQRRFSQELRIGSEGVRTIDYVAGLYYLWQDIKAHAVNAYGTRAAASTCNCGVATYSTNNTLSHVPPRIPARSRSAPAIPRPMASLCGRDFDICIGLASIIRSLFLERATGRHHDVPFDRPEGRRET